MIAKTILDQLGGIRFIITTGSHQFIDLGDGLRMNLARNRTSANRLKITLDKATDSYIMTFYRQALTKHFEVKITEIAQHDGVYCDVLEEIFTSVTGLCTKI